MWFAFELAPRQSARLVERARREEVPVEVHPRDWDDDRVLSGRLVGGGTEGLRVDLTADIDGNVALLLGSHCEARFTLEANRYLFGTTILDAGAVEAARWLDLALPVQLMVTERRQCWRTPLAKASEVRITPQSTIDGHLVRAVLCNLSSGGLACSVLRADLDLLLIGELVHLAFELPDGDRRYLLSGIVCNKTPAGSSDKYIVGIQFLASSEDRESQMMIESIRSVLYARQSEGFVERKKN